MQTAVTITETGAAVCALCIFLGALTPAGVALINTGFGRSRSAAHALLNALCAFAAAVLVYLVVGFSLQSYAGGPAHAITIGGRAWNLIGSERLFLLGVKFDGSMNVVALIACLQLLSVGLSAVIPLGTGADRWKLGASTISAALFAAITYPVLAHWVWGGGWLAQCGALDAGGAGVVQATGGLRALAITWILGPRQGKYETHGMAIPGHNMAMVLFGCGVALTGFLGLDAAGAMLFAGATVSSLPLVAINLLASSSAAVLTAMAVTRMRYAKPDASICANGFLAGLVAISGACSLVPPAAAIAIGFVAGLLLPLAVEWLDRLGFDDPSGAISVHGLGGIWGVLAVGIFVSRPGQWLAQLAVVSVLLGFSLPLSYGLNLLLNRIHPQRISSDGERLGLDMSELGAGAYPELSASIKDQYR